MKLVVVAFARFQKYSVAVFAFAIKLLSSDCHRILCLTCGISHSMHALLAILAYHIGCKSQKQVQHPEVTISCLGPGPSVLCTSTS